MSTTTTTTHLQTTAFGSRCGAILTADNATGRMDRVTCHICRPSLALDALHANLRAAGR